MNKCKNCQSVLPDRVPGQRGRNQLFCNEYCGHLFRGGIKHLDKPTHCGWCQVELVQKGAGNPRRYCSRQHAGMYLNSKKPKAPKSEKSCVWCSKTFITNLPKMKFCSYQCRAAQLTHRNSQATVKKHEGNPRRFDFECDRCKQIVVTDVCIRKTYSGRFCRNCSLVKRRERYRLKTANRQKIMNPIRVSADALIQRDGNVCHICLTEIDLMLARNSRFGATIDHVVPVSKGGADTLDNMRLAHWICNIKKGNRV